MPIPGAWIETLQNPVRYTRAQIILAAAVAAAMARGKLVLCEPPGRAAS